MSQKKANKIEEDVRNVFIAVSGGINNATKRKVAFIVIELKAALKRVLTQIKMETEAAISRIQEELERNAREALRNIAACRDVMHNCRAKVCRTLLGAAILEAASEPQVVVAEPWQIDILISMEVCKYVTENSGAKAQ